MQKLKTRNLKASGYNREYYASQHPGIRRSYQYDALGRPTSRTLARQGTTRNDAFTYNDRSESPRRLVGGLDKPRSVFAPQGGAGNGAPASQLISDVVDGTGLNGWDYDNIGNRLVQQQGSACDTYTSNALNQYTAIEDESHDVFTPTYDDDGNQTRIKTSTGIWNVTYNAKNRPVLFTKDDNSVSVACTYDYMGRRATKVVTENGQIITSHRFLYRGYLQIACCDRTRANHPCLWLITWNPTQDAATRPLAIQKDGTWYTYGWDLTKNIWEAYNTSGYIGTAYTYTAYGQVTANGSITQPIQWSSEYNDTELGLVYYNYRHYNPVDGKWIGRDKIEPDYNLYRIGQNKVAFAIDLIGRASCTIWTGMHNVPDQGFCPCPEHPQSIGIAFLNGEPGENEHFKNIASVNGRKAYYPSTGKDFLNELKRVTKENCGNCINILTIAGHGHSTCMTKNGIPGEDIENDEGFYYDLTNMAYHSTDATDIKNLKREISNRNIVFCKGGCLIQIYGCRIGRLFASELASVTGCNVVYASGSCFSDEKDVHTWLSGRGSYGEKNDNGEDYMGFMEALPDGTIRKIGSTNSNNISIYNPK